MKNKSLKTKLYWQVTIYEREKINEKLYKQIRTAVFDHIIYDQIFWHIYNIGLNHANYRASIKNTRVSSAKNIN